MGSIVEYRCGTCAFSTGQLSVGWGKPGRQEFWGGLARCNPCKKIGVVNLTGTQADSDRRCVECNGPLTLHEGTSVAIQCPHCGASMKHAAIGTWM